AVLCEAPITVSVSSAVCVLCDRSALFLVLSSGRFVCAIWFLVALCPWSEREALIASA
ncbi:hypothetical protein U1Q18_038895, partial [Sarracenia purpurea var. burkii]